MKIKNLCKALVLFLLASQASNASKIGSFSELGIPSFSRMEPSYLHLSEVSSSIEHMENAKTSLFEHEDVAKCNMGNPGCGEHKLHK